MKAPAGQHGTIGTEVTEDVEGEAIAWKSAEGGDIKNAGRIEFPDAPAGRGTVVTANIVYDPPGGDARQADRQAVPRTSRRSRRAATSALQAADGNRRDRHRRANHHNPVKENTDARTDLARQHDVRVDTVPDPEIVNPRDAIIKITSTAICGSDLHLYDGYIPTMQTGDILGHEFMGEVVEVGPEQHACRRASGSSCRSPSPAASASSASKQQYSACDNSNPAEKPDMSEMLYGYAMGGAFGYSHLTGGYAGGQAEYVRVPFSDVGPIVIPDGHRGRQGAVPVRHPADRLDGGGELPRSSPATPSRSGAAARSACSRSRAPS